MEDFDLFDEHFIPEPGASRYPSNVRLALLNGRQSQLQDESENWYRSYLPKFAAIAAQLRRESMQREEDLRPRLELALHFEELAMQPPCYSRTDEDQGPY